MTPAGTYVSCIVVLQVTTQ